MTLNSSPMKWTFVVLACWLLLDPDIASRISADEVPPLNRVAAVESKGRPGTLDHLFVDSGTSRLFLTNQTNNTLDVIDLKSNRLVTQVAGQEAAHSVVYVAAQERLYVGCGGGTCNVLDAKSYALVKSLPVPGADSVRYDARSKRVAVANRKSLTLIDSEKLEIVATVKLPGTPDGFQTAKDRPRIYVNSEPPTQVVVIDSQKNEAITTFDLAGGSKSLGPITLDEVSGRIFVGLRASPRLVALDIDTRKEVATVPIPEGADDMFHDADSKWIFVSSSAGYITIIRQLNADRYETVADVPTLKGAKTSFYDPVVKRLYLGVPRQANQEGPEIWVFRMNGERK